MTLLKLENVNLSYELYHDRTNSLKEFIVNLLYRRRFVERRSSYHHALKDVSFSIAHGERVGIIGGNGAGKSTLLRVLARIIEPQTGSVTIHGQVQPLIEVAAGFNPELSGLDNVFLNAYYLGFTRKQVMSRIDEIIKFADIGEYIDVPIKYYSTGMAMRLAFTIATLIDPDILLFDEMLSTGDAGFLVKAKAKIESLVNRARVIILVSHDLDLISSFCSRVLVLHKGQLVYDGDPKKAINEYLRLNVPN